MTCIASWPLKEEGGRQLIRRMAMASTTGRKTSHQQPHLDSTHRESRGLSRQSPKACMTCGCPVRGKIFCGQTSCGTPSAVSGRATRGIVWGSFPRVRVCEQRACGLVDLRPRLGAFHVCSQADIPAGWQAREWEILKLPFFKNNF